MNLSALKDVRDEFDLAKAEIVAYLKDSIKMELPPYLADDDSLNVIEAMLLRDIMKELTEEYLKARKGGGIEAFDVPPGRPLIKNKLSWYRPSANRSFISEISWLSRKIIAIMNHIKRDPFASMVLRDRMHYLPYILETSRFPPKTPRSPRLIYLSKVLKMIENIGKRGKREGYEFRETAFGFLFELYVASLILREDKVLRLKFKGSKLSGPFGEAYLNVKLNGSCFLDPIIDIFLPKRKTSIIIECKFYRDDKEALRRAYYQLSAYEKELGKDYFFIAVVRSRMEEVKVLNCNFGYVKLSFMGDIEEDSERHRRLLLEILSMADEAFNLS
ncbi:hypothetical protein IPA_01700 [Ignicoccus pacificus DSM 13166]|uniref:Uncharacterized protein n=1 Tax=Ignicoccus pacificus DSM 13166 TaxID=940294 RepID=A0A977KAK0_9CREN|nr:hypothetical protein IPA_01700 [Ignicoccus pacificus DSM 13166]